LQQYWDLTHVLRFAALGIVYVFATFLVGLGFLWAAWRFWVDHDPLFAIPFAVIGLSLSFVALLSMRLGAPIEQGVEIYEQDAPELFRILAKLRKKLKAPAIDRVVITEDYNAFISQQPRFGFFGTTTNTLGIGLPLAANISAQRLVAVLAHEYAHLRRGDGKSAAWIYRTRMAWERLAYTFDDDDQDIFSIVTVGFSRWYAPRLTAKTFAAARQEEYTADKLSAKLCGVDCTASALIEIALLRDHAGRSFWEQYWALCVNQAQPQVLPYSWLCKGLQEAPSPIEIQKALHALKTEKSHSQGTHPTTRERVQALQAELQIPAPSVVKALSLLGRAATKVAVQFDEAWWSQQKSNWTARHARSVQDTVKINDMQTKIRHLGVKELERLAQLIARSQPKADLLPLYEHILSVEPSSPHALWQVAIHHAERGELASLSYLDRILTQHAHLSYGAASVALELLDRQRYDLEIGKLRERYRAALKKYEILEETAQEEASNQNEHPLMSCSRNELTAFELEDVRYSAQLQAQISRLWLLRKNNKTFPWRKYYVAIIQISNKYAKDHIDIDAIAQSLDLPGQCIGLDERWLGEIIPEKAMLPPLGEPVYPALQ
jgi:Zn-dependent protease with chaperone function